MYSLRSTPISPPKSQPQQPLSSSVRAALKKYFSNLDGEPGTKLYELVMREVEAPLLEVVMEHCNWNQSTAAKCLGISRGTLRKLLVRYRINAFPKASS